MNYLGTSHLFSNILQAYPEDLLDALRARLGLPGGSHGQL